MRISVNCIAAVGNKSMDFKWWCACRWM